MPEHNILVKQWFAIALPIHMLMTKTIKAVHLKAIQGLVYACMYGDYVYKARLGTNLGI